MYEGKGIYFDTKNNQKYDGHFCNGLRHGNGKLYLFRQNRVFNGQFENDKQVRGQSSSLIKNGAAEAACCREGKPIRPLVIIKKIIVIIGKNKNKNKNKDKNKK